MVYRLQKLPTPQGVQPSETATLRLPLGPTYNTLFLEVKSGAGVALTAANIDAGIGEIRLAVDGDVKLRGPASFWRKRAAFYGRAAVDGILPIHLSSPWARQAIGEDSTAYGTAAGMSQLTLEVDFTAALTTPTMQVFARQSAPRAFGSHLRVQPFADNFGFTGEHEMSGMPPLGPFGLLGLDIDSSTVSDVEVIANSVSQYRSSALVREFMLKDAGRVPQTGFTHIDFIAENRMDMATPLNLTDFRTKVSFTTAPDAFTVFATTIQNAQIR